MTGKEMCEAIVEAGFARREDGGLYTAEEIWNLSPQGNLFHVFEWYGLAKALKEADARLPLPMPQA